MQPGRSITVRTLLKLRSDFADVTWQSAYTAPRDTVSLVSSILICYDCNALYSSFFSVTAPSSLAALLQPLNFLAVLLLRISRL